MYKVFDGLKVVKAVTGTTTQKVALTGYCNSVMLINDGSADVKITINGIELTSKPGDNPLDECFEPFLSIDIATTGGSYRLIVRG